MAAAVRSGDIAGICALHHLELMVLFGSAARLLDSDTDSDGPMPRDIDIAVRSTHGTLHIDQLALLQDLYRLTGSERINLMLLDDAGPVARQRALTRGRLLFEASPSLFAEAQISASPEYLDTAFLGRLGLVALAQQ